MRTTLATILTLALVCTSVIAVVAQESEPMSDETVIVRGTQQWLDEIGETGDWQARREGMSDPRLDGEVLLEGTIAYEAREEPPGADESPHARWGTVTVTNDEGSWHGRSIGFVDEWGELRQIGWLEGHGAYEGLTFIEQWAYPESRGRAEVVGLLYEGEIPPMVLPAPGPANEQPTEATASESIGEPADSGARIIDVAALDERTVDLTIDSPAVGTEKVRLLLPAGFDREADTDWPVLYLLHGAFDDYTSWTRETDVAELTAGLPLLVAMPEAGEDGWYADWWNGGEGGPPMWETFHLTEVRELLERNWQAGDDRVVAGVSMGGLGAMSYAARHPDLFKAAAAFSGVLHPTTLAFDLHPDLWGDRTAQSDVWEAHDPVLLADALEGMPLYVSYGNGEPGPLDAGEAGADDPEPWIAEMNDAFVVRLEELGIPAVVDAYGPGTHTWPYFERGLHEAMPMLLEALGT
ncbi:MAG: alpha/beta hydrolase family protein [Chloroflexota bacterium]|jgi:S-formylglutathione hydrolase FrmB